MLSALAAATLAAAFVLFGAMLACIVLGLMTVAGLIDWIRNAR
jgi:hypothetical protein